ncbi:hypothetical protein [Moraxella lacunata]|uniref:hypothetical protein n=1 Tax=Moraxella lacunata TaxID=477 RepID=UPI003EE3EAAF
MCKPCHWWGFVLFDGKINSKIKWIIYDKSGLTQPQYLLRWDILPCSCGQVGS